MPARALRDRAFGAGAPLPAQIIVDPSGGGHYTQLQAAIDAAPPGAILLVRGGSYDPVRIDKSLVLLGEPRFEIYQFQHAAPRRRSRSTPARSG